MRNKARWIAGAGIAVGVISGSGVAVAATSPTGEEADVAITGPALERAAAALESTGSGEVTETEVGDEEGYYEVEVTLPDGSEVDVHLTSDFTVIGTEADSGSEQGD